MDVLLIGSGGREHALARAIAGSAVIGRLFAAPGNPGIAEEATLVALDVADHVAVIEFCRRERISFVVVGPEAPLVAGLVDALEDAGIAAFGPSQAAARLEGSKGFTKDLCARHSIPTAAYRRFTDQAEAEAHVRAVGAPIVVKADGLAAGKGVTVAATLDEALGAVTDCFSGVFGAAGAEVVIEDMMVGEEASFFALCDGRHALALGSAQDHKRVFDGDLGPNTGGMGAYSPAPIMTPDLEARVMAEIIRPTVAAMAAEGAPFKGVLYAGLMITAEGPKLIEYNVRFGDPETQVLLPRLKDDILLLMKAARDGLLDRVSCRLRDEAALTIVMAARGYPGPVARGEEIRGLGRAGALPDVTIYHAATKRDGERLVSDGGRVLNVTALGRDVAEAQTRAYAAVDAIDWPGGFCRRDIGHRAVGRKPGAR